MEEAEKEEGEEEVEGERRKMKWRIRKRKKMTISRPAITTQNEKKRDWSSLRAIELRILTELMWRMRASATWSQRSRGGATSHSTRLQGFISVSWVFVGGGRPDDDGREGGMGRKNSG